MSPKGLLILSVLTLLSVILAFTAITGRDQPIHATMEVQTLVPGLAERLNDVSKIRSIVEGRGTTIERTEHGWRVSEKGGYFADGAKVEEVARALADARLIEPKTDNPARLPRLELEDPRRDNARSALVALDDAAGREIAAVIVGKERHGLFGPGRSGSYVRRAGEMRAWLADRRLEVPQTTLDWLQREIIDLPRDRLARLALRPGHQDAVVLTRSTPDAERLELSPIPAGREADQEKIDRLADSFARLSLQDVDTAEALAEALGGAQAAQIETIDGLVIAVRAVRRGEGEAVEYWLHLSPRAGRALPREPQAAADADSRVLVDHVEELRRRLEPFAFKVPRYVAERLFWLPEELLKPPGKTS